MMITTHGLLRQVMQWCIVLTLALGSSAHALSQDEPGLDPASYPALGTAHPEWVKPIEPFRLVDEQINAMPSQTEAYFYAVEMDLVSARGVATESTLRLSYQNDYQRLAVNQVLIKRGDKIINKLPTALHQLLDLEPELGSLMVLGHRELALTLQDVQIGDTLYYSYTVTGTNPVYDGLREHYAPMDFGVSVDRVSVRLLVGPDERMSIRRRNLDDLPVFEQFDTHAEYRFEATNTKPLRTDSDAPSWYRPSAAIAFSDIKTWNDVVSWAQPLYDDAVDQSTSVPEIANAIMAEHKTEKARIGAALEWVQHNIRYWGIETGVNSHKPRPADLVIDRGFGDCKDKTVLLVSILKSMNIKASPALVNTDETTRNTDNPFRIHAFDHVITHVKVDGIDHWLDPTMTGQVGSLGELYEPDYGLALIVDDGQDELTDMANTFSGGKKRIAKIITAGAEVDATATLKVMTYRTGYNAEYTRRKFEDDSSAEIALDYLDYYRDRFDEITLAKPLEVKTYSKNRILVTESYDIGTLWTSDYEGDPPYRWFHADEIQGVLEQPNQPKFRTAPFDIRYPMDVTEAYALHLDEVETDEAYEDELETKWFKLSATYSQDSIKDVLKVSWRFRTLVRTVSADDAVEYSKAIDEAHEWLSFYGTSSGFYQDAAEEEHFEDEQASDSAGEELLVVDAED